MFIMHALAATAAQVTEKEDLFTLYSTSTLSTSRGARQLVNALRRLALTPMQSC